MAVKSENFLHGLNLSCKRSIRSLSWIVLGVTLSAWGEDDAGSHHPPLFEKGYPRLKIGFETTNLTETSGLNLCGGSCAAGDVAVSRDMPDEAQSYEQGFNLNLGQGGPLLIRFSDRGLKMEVNF